VYCCRSVVCLRRHRAWKLFRGSCRYGTVPSKPQCFESLSQLTVPILIVSPYVPRSFRDSGLLLRRANGSLLPERMKSEDNLAEIEDIYQSNRGRSPIASSILTKGRGAVPRIVKTVWVACPFGKLITRWSG
jgi:hypothetical protein